MTHTSEATEESGVVWVQDDLALRSLFGIFR